MQIILIAAVAKNMVIGHKNQIPWNIPGEQKIFKQLTIGHTVIMGRNTYESIGRLLPDRNNIVITKQSDYPLNTINLAHSLDSALAKCLSSEKVFIIGGAQLYAQALDKADKLYLTELRREVVGDTYFPDFSRSFHKISSEEIKLTEIVDFNVYSKSK